MKFVENTRISRHGSQQGLPEIVGSANADAQEAASNNRAGSSMPGTSESTMANGQTASHGRVLHSWKEIARYMGRGVRTIQRYETHFGLPVHRPSGGLRGAVLAFPQEIDQWLSQTPTRVEMSKTNNGDNSVVDHRCLATQSVYNNALVARQVADAVQKRLELMQTLVDRLTVKVHARRKLASRKSSISGSTME